MNITTLGKLLRFERQLMEDQKRIGIELNDVNEDF